MHTDAGLCSSTILPALKENRPPSAQIRLKQGKSSLKNLLAVLALLAACAHAAMADDNLEVAEFKARAGNMTATAISNDGQFVFTGEDDGLVTLWNVATTGTSFQNFMGHTREVFATALLPDGKRGVTCGDDNMVIVWELATGKRLHEMSTGDSIPLVMACTRDGAFAATGCDDGRIDVWDLATGNRVAALPHPASVCGATFSPDGHLLAAGYSDGRVVVWDAASWKQKYTLPDADHASVGALAFSPDNRLLATGNQNGGGFMWNAADGTPCCSFAGYARPEVTPAPPVAPVFPGSVITPDNRSAILYLVFSADSSLLLGSIQDAPARFWEAKTGRFLGTANWFEDNRFYIARYGFPYPTAVTTPDRKFIVLMKENLAQVWQCPWKPVPPGTQ
jgi:WD40 repeat protein